MKVRPILLLLLLAGLICAVGWLYYAVTRPAVEVHAEGNLEVISEPGRGTVVRMIKKVHAGAWIPAYQV